MAELVYVLCFMTSALCALLLLRGYRRTSNRLLLWSGLCFVGLGLNNLALVVDKLVLPLVDLGLVRTALALLGVCTLLFGLIWEDPR